jgi:hypothetical protein
LNVSIFEFIDENKNNLVVFPEKTVNDLKKIYDGQEDKDRLFFLKKNSSRDFFLVRFFILVKKYLAIGELEKIYERLGDSFVLMRDFLIKNKSDKELELTSLFLEKIKKQKNPELFQKADFKVEDLLYENMKDSNEEIEFDSGRDSKEANKNMKECLYTAKQSGLKKNEKRMFEVTEDEILIYNKKGKIVKRFKKSIVKTGRKIPFIEDYVEINGVFYYFGITEDKGESVPEEKYENIILKLLKKKDKES